ncbi:hypothetical protein [Arthrobacter antioxidans]|uniref:hypothetical protein n=1 Tax=Arthrobacter antioxidans TaxID=2895818 RepID=UPI001FFE3F5F|nr:hypothetical protein [Arthrobacter antioxidans]
MQRVIRAVDRQIARDPAWFDACWVIRDQRGWPADKKHRRRTREQASWEHYAGVLTLDRTEALGALGE